MTGIEELGTAIGLVAERVGPSVAGIGERWRGGCGVVIAQDRVLTNAHNVGEDGATVLLGGTAIEARLVGVDADGDVAVLELPDRGRTCPRAGELGGPRHRAPPVISLGRASDGGVRRHPGSS